MRDPFLFIVYSTEFVVEDDFKFKKLHYKLQT